VSLLNACFQGFPFSLKLGSGGVRGVAMPY
jgi:hypothetical protein